MRATGLRMDLGEGREMSSVGGEPLGHMSGRVRGRKLRVRSTLRPREASCRSARGQPCSVGKGSATIQRSPLTLFP
jgi:hypothetical protein